MAIRSSMWVGLTALLVLSCSDDEPAGSGGAGGGTGGAAGQGTAAAGAQPSGGSGGASTGGTVSQRSVPYDEIRIAGATGCYDAVAPRD